MGATRTMGERMPLMRTVRTTSRAPAAWLRVALAAPLLLLGACDDTYLCRVNCDRIYEDCLEEDHSGPIACEVGYSDCMDRCDALAAPASASAPDASPP